MLRAPAVHGVSSYDLLNCYCSVRDYGGSLIRGQGVDLCLNRVLDHVWRNFTQRNMEFQLSFSIRLECLEILKRTGPILKRTGLNSKAYRTTQF